MKIGGASGAVGGHPPGPHQRALAHSGMLRDDRSDVLIRTVRVRRMAALAEIVVRSWQRRAVDRVDWWAGHASVQAGRNHRTIWFGITKKELSGKKEKSCMACRPWDRRRGRTPLRVGWPSASVVSVGGEDGEYSRRCFTEVRALFGPCPHEERRRSCRECMQRNHHARAQRDVRSERMYRLIGRYVRE